MSEVGVEDQDVSELKNYIAREPGTEVSVIPTSDEDGTTLVLASVIHQNTDPELGELPDFECYDHSEQIRDVKLGEDLPVDQQCPQKNLIRWYPNVFIDNIMPKETDVIQHKVKLTDDTLSWLRRWF